MSNGFLTRLSAILIVLVIILGYISLRVINSKNNEITQQSTLINALNDTLKSTRNELGEEKAHIASLTTQSTADFLKIQSKDSEIVHLQDVVKQYKSQLASGGSVVTITNETVIHDTTNQVLIYKDTSGYPTYSSLITKKWYVAGMKMKRDTAILDLKVFNAYDVVLGKDKKTGWYANVINHNPYSSTKTMRAYNVEVPKSKPKRVGLGIFGGYGLPLSGTIKAGPFIGAGITYNLFYLF